MDNAAHIFIPIRFDLRIIQTDIPAFFTKMIASAYPKPRFPFKFHFLRVARRKIRRRCIIQRHWAYSKLRTCFCKLPVEELAPEIKGVVGVRQEGLAAVAELRLELLHLAFEGLDAGFGGLRCGRG